jgi:acid phosphatase (class A)
MRAKLLAAAAFAACALVSTVSAPLSAKTEADHLSYLDPALFAPALNVPAPPPRGSAEEARELDALHRLIAGATPSVSPAPGPMGTMRRRRCSTMLSASI